MNSKKKLTTKNKKKIKTKRNYYYFFLKKKITKKKGWLPVGVAWPPTTNGDGHTPPLKEAGSGARPPQWGGFLGFICLYFFIIIDTCRYLIGIDMTPNGIC